MLKVVHIVKQVFTWLGGEEKARHPIVVVEGPSNTARGLQAQLGEEGKVVATIIHGGNYIHKHVDEAMASILNEVESQRPEVVVAGLAFSSARYDLNCIEVCQTVSESLEIP